MPAHRKPESLQAPQTRANALSAANKLAAYAAGTEPLGDAPEGLTESELKAWQELAVAATAARSTDRIAVELAARLLARIRSGLGTGADATNLRSLLASLGLTPADRAKVPQPKRTTNNSFADV